MSRYGRKLTKQDLIDAGITEITENGEVFRGEIKLNFSINNQGYKTIAIYDRDKNGKMIKIIPKNSRPGYYIYKTRTIGLHRAMWAWFYGEVPDGMVVDHINNQHENLDDYRLDNLQLLTPAENLEKEREFTKMLKCQMTKPREFYENKLNYYTELYEKAKAESDAEAAHTYRTSVANYKARIRYWDEHKEEYDQYIAEKAEQDYKRQEKKASVRDRKILAQYKQVFKEAGNKAMWHEVCKVEKMWDSLQSIQKEHIFKVLHNFFSKHGMTL